jgi:hypothetical protein
MADIFDPLDITGFSDEDIAFLDLYMAACLGNEPFYNFQGVRDDYDAFQSLIRNPLNQYTLAPFNMEKGEVVKLMKRLGPTFEQFCKETLIHGIRRKLDPFPMLANGFAACKAMQLRRLERNEEILRLQKENQGLANEGALLKGKATSDESKIKELQDGRVSNQTVISKLGKQVSGLETDLKLWKAQVTQLENECADWKGKATNKPKWYKTSGWAGTFATIIIGGLTVVLMFIQNERQGTKLEAQAKTIEEYEGEKSKAKGEIDSLKSTIESIQRASMPSQSSVDAQASSPDSSKTYLLVPYLKDTQPHVNPKQRTFKQGK